MRSPRTAVKSSPPSPQLEKTRAQQQRPNAAEKKNKVHGRQDCLLIRVVNEVRQPLSNSFVSLPQGIRSKLTPHRSSFPQEPEPEKGAADPGTTGSGHRWATYTQAFLHGKSYGKQALGLGTAEEEEPTVN